jgi:hypothetical protein
VRWAATNGYKIVLGISRPRQLHVPIASGRRASCVAAVKRPLVVRRMCAQGRGNKAGEAAGIAAVVRRSYPDC